MKNYSKKALANFLVETRAIDTTGLTTETVKTVYDNAYQELEDSGNAGRAIMQYESDIAILKQGLQFS